MAMTTSPIAALTTARLDLDDLTVPAVAPSPDPRERAIGWGPRFDFVFAGDWLTDMFDAGADYDCLDIWVRLHATRDRHRRPPGQGSKDRSVASVLGTTRIDGETDREHLARMGRQVELAFPRRRASVVSGPNVAGSYFAIASRRDVDISAALVEVLARSPYDGDHQARVMPPEEDPADDLVEDEPLAP